MTVRFWGFPGGLAVFFKLVHREGNLSARRLGAEIKNFHRGKTGKSGMPGTARTCLNRFGKIGFLGRLWRGSGSSQPGKRKKVSSSPFSRFFPPGRGCPGFRGWVGEASEVGDNNPRRGKSGKVLREPSHLLVAVTLERV